MLNEIKPLFSAFVVVVGLFSIASLGVSEADKFTTNDYWSQQNAVISSNRNH